MITTTSRLLLSDRCPEGLAPAPPRVCGLNLPPDWRDRCLSERIERALANSGFWPLRFVKVTVDGGLVYLHGRVPSFYLKQVAQAVAGRVANNRDLLNRIEVA